jgi:WD40 repeat protein
MLLSCSIAVLFVGYGLISDSLQPCGSLDSYLSRSNCLKVLQYSYSKSHIFDISFSPDGQLIVAGGLGDSPKVWDVESGELLHKINPQASGAIETTKFSPNGQIIAIGQNYISSTLTIADPKNGSVLYYVGDLPHIGDIAFSPDSAVLALVSNVDNKSSIDFRRVSDGQLIHSFSIDDDIGIRKVVFSLDGERLFGVSYGENPGIYSWQIDTGEQIGRISLDVKDNLGIAFSPDGNILALGNCVGYGEYGCNKAEITLWQTNDGQLLHRLSVRGAYVSDLAFSEDGAILASSTTDGEMPSQVQSQVQIWRVSDGALLDTLEEQTGRVQEVAFSPDGSILAVGLADVILWNVE